MIRFVITAALLAAALGMVLVALVGVFRFRFVLNRMHAASMLDTFGMVLVTAAILVEQGLRTADWKLLLIVALLWIGSPISSHLLARLEVMTDDELSRHLTVEDEGGPET